jgi:hypothetical protein
MTQLVEYNGTAYNNGLTHNEKAYLQAQEQINLGDCTLSIFKQTLSYGIVLYGIKTLPSDEETNLLYAVIQGHYRYVTIGELALAFQLNAVGQDWPRVECFGLMSVAFLSDVLKQYSEYKMKMNLAIDKKKQKLSIPAPSIDESTPVNWLQMFTDDIQMWKENKRDYVLMLAPMKVRTFYDKKIIRDEMWSDDDWKKWQFMAYKKTLDAQSISVYKAKRLDKLSRQKFKDDYQCELSRLIYSDIMDSHILQQKIKDGL